MACNCGKGVVSHQYLSSPNPTDISFAIFSGLLGSTVLTFFVGLDDDPFLVEVFWHFDPPCMVKELSGSDCLGFIEEDNGVVIMGDGCMTFNGLGVFTFGVFLFVFLDEETAFGVFMVNRNGE